MEKILWTKEFSVNNELLDNQHKQIISMINTLIDKQNLLLPFSEEIHELLTSMTNYFRTHFQDEEKFMEKIKFPALEEHKSLHISYIDKMVDFNFAKLTAKDNLANEMMEYLLYWLKNHILIEDQKYKNFLIIKKQ
jgi:hemerythrin-like metal-binding protein